MQCHVNPFSISLLIHPSSLHHVVVPRSPIYIRRLGGLYMPGLCAVHLMTSLAGSGDVTAYAPQLAATKIAAAACVTKATLRNAIDVASQAGVRPYVRLCDRPTPFVEWRASQYMSFVTRHVVRFRREHLLLHVATKNVEKQRSVGVISVTSYVPATD